MERAARTNQRLIVEDSSDDDTPIVSPESSPPRPRSTPHINKRVSLSKNNSAYVNGVDLEAFEANDNDDYNERKARRQSRLMEIRTVTLNSPAAAMASTRPARRPAPLSGMSNDQVAEHYGNCIKLAAENKITSKNAFSLHLIDYMTDMLKSMANFQVASSSLDAGAKIYAGRVDAVHQETYKVLTGLGRSKEKVREEELPGENEEDAGGGVESEGEEEEGAARRTKRKEEREKRKKNVLQKNLAKIRLKAVQLKFDMDPLFQQQGAAYDEGGTGDLRLNHVRVLDQSSELLLDSNVLVVAGGQSEATTSSARRDAPPSLVDVTGFRDTLSLLRPRIGGPEEMLTPAASLPVCSAFVDFLFMGWNKNDDDSQTSFAHMSQANKHAFDAEKAPGPVDIDDQGTAFSDGDIPPNDDSDASLNADVPDDQGGPVNASVYIGDSKEAMLVQSAMENIQGGNVTGTASYVSSLRDMLTRQLDEYGELNDNLLGMWAGPDHWRAKAKKASLALGRLGVGNEGPNPDATSTSGLTLQSGRSKKTKSTRSKRQPAPVLYAEAVDGQPLITRYGRVVKRDWGRLFGTSRASTTLSDQSLNKNIKANYSLPPEMSCTRESIFQFMNKEIALLVGKPVPEPGTVLDDQQVGDYDFANPHDMGEFCPLSQDPGHGEEGGPPPEEGGAHFDDDDDDDVGPYDCVFTQMMSPRAEEELMGTGGMELLSQPRKIAKIDIGYAKSAKRINVRHLKRSMWTFLSGEETATPANTSQLEGSVPETRHLSGLLKDLPHRVSKQTSQELSVPIVLTCLLHLANEKDLYLESVEGFSDLLISQGLPVGEQDLLKQYQNSPRKRKSVSSAKRGGKKPVRTMIDDWLDGSNVDDDAEARNQSDSSD